MRDQANAIICRECGGTDIEPRGVVVAVQPYERPKLAGTRRYEKIIEHKYCCRECAGEFSITQEVYEA